MATPSTQFSLLLREQEQQRGTDRGNSDEATPVRRGRYSRLGPDRHPPLPNLTSILLVPKFRPGRLQYRRQTDTKALQSYGDAPIYKDPGSIRIFLQNVKGLTYSTGVEDYKYYLSQMAAYSVDCFGLVETNTAWQQYYLQLQYRECVQRQFRIGKTVFGFPSHEVDPCSAKSQV